MLKVPHCVVLTSGVEGFVAVNTVAPSDRVNVQVPVSMITFWTNPATSTARDTLFHAA